MAKKKEKSPLKKKMGRPKIPLVVPDLKNLEERLPSKEIHLDKVLYWADIGATQEEIAGSFYVSVDTLGRRIKEQTGLTFAELKEKCCGKAKIKVRNNQFKLSEKNATMAIWLGKIWLGQKEENNNKELIETFVQIMRKGDEDEIKSHLSQVP